MVRSMPENFAYFRLPCAFLVSVRGVAHTSNWELVDYLQFLWNEFYTSTIRGKGVLVSAFVPPNSSAIMMAISITVNLIICNIIGTCHVTSDFLMINV